MVNKNTVSEPVSFQMCLMFCLNVPYLGKLQDMDSQLCLRISVMCLENGAIIICSLYLFDFSFFLYFYSGTNVCMICNNLFRVWVLRQYVYQQFPIQGILDWDQNYWYLTNTPPFPFFSNPEYVHTYNLVAIVLNPSLDEPDDKNKASIITNRCGEPLSLQSFNYKHTYLFYLIAFEQNSHQVSDEI